MDEHQRFRAVLAKVAKLEKADRYVWKLHMNAILNDPKGPSMTAADAGEKAYADVIDGQRFKKAKKATTKTAPCIRYGRVCKA